jgi:hypothetical protein
MGQVVGDLIISWPDNRTSPEKEANAARVVVSAAQDLSARLGSGPERPEPRGGARQGGGRRAASTSLDRGKSPRLDCR